MILMRDIATDHLTLAVRYLSIDKCDQNKTILPCVHDMLLISIFATVSFFLLFRKRLEHHQGLPHSCSSWGSALLLALWVCITLAQSASWRHVQNQFSAAFVSRKLRRVPEVRMSSA